MNSTHSATATEHLTLVLREYETRAGIKLSPIQLQWLQDSATSLDLTIQPTPGTPGAYTLSTKGKVGVMQWPNLRLELQPKIKIANLLFLLSYSLAPAVRDTLLAQMGLQADLHETLARMFVRQVALLVRQGLLSGYHEVAESGPVLRGRLDIATQLNRHYNRYPPLACKFQDYSEDIPENRLLVSALNHLQHLNFRHPELHWQQGNLSRHFGGVGTPLIPGQQLPAIPITRLNQHYLPALGLARLILSNSSFAFTTGNIAVSSFIVDMWKVFEDFVTVALRECLGLNPQNFPQNAQGRKLWLDQNQRKIELLPDLSWWEDGQCRFVGDVKYKFTKEGENSDIYQMLAYITATRLECGLLLYAASHKADQTYTLPGNLRIKVKSLDLDQSPAALLAQIQDLGQWISHDLGKGQVWFSGLGSDGV